MFFLMRCVFWLAIVFHAMDWPQGQSLQEAILPAGALKAAASAAGDLASATAITVESKLEEACRLAPEDCLTYAARLVATPRLDVMPPKRPVRLAESDAARTPAGRKAAAERPASK